MEASTLLDVLAILAMFENADRTMSKFVFAKRLSEMRESKISSFLRNLLRLSLIRLFDNSTKFWTDTGSNYRLDPIAEVAVSKPN